MNYYIEVFKKYAVFSGRARRKEYWYFTLFNIIVLLMLALIASSIKAIFPSQEVLGTLFFLVYSLAMIIPSIAVTVRRLHDTNRSGWFILINFVPLIGPIVVFVFMVLDSDPDANQYGPNPKTPSV